MQIKYWFFGVILLCFMSMGTNWAQAADPSIEPVEPVDTVEELAPDMETTQPEPIDAAPVVVTPPPKTENTPTPSPMTELILFQEIPIVSGVSKTEESIKDVPMAVYVVTREELRRWGVRYFYELFQRVPGYSFYNTDYYGQYGPIGRGMQSIWRYGFSFELMNVVDFGHLTFAPNFFKSIEIARGPAGLMWGSAAEAGLINLNVRDDLKGLEVSVQGGNFERKAADILYGGQFEKAGDGFFVGWHGEMQSPEVIDDAFDVPDTTWKINGENFAYNFLGKLKYEDWKCLFYMDHADHIGPTLWYGNSDFGGAPVLQEALEQFQPNMHDQMEVLAYRIEYHLPLHLDYLSVYLYHDYYKKQWWTESVALDTQRKRSAGFNSQAKFLEDSLILDLGGTFWGEDQIYAPSFTSWWANTNYGIDWYNGNLSPVKITNRDVYLQAKYAILTNLKIIAGGRADMQRKSGDEETNYSPRGCLIYEPLDDLTLKYIYNDTKRRPQANEIAPDVSYESLNAHDLVCIYEISETARVNVTVFKETLADKITRNNDENALNAFVNTGGLDVSGAELDAKYNAMKDLLVYANGSYQISKINTGAEGVPDPANSDDEPLFVPAITAFAGAEYLAAELVRINLAVRYIGDIPYINIDLEETKTSVYFIDLTLRSVQLLDEHVELAIVALNLLDNKSRVPAFGEHAGNSIGTLQPEGRRLYGQVTFNW